VGIALIANAIVVSPFLFLGAKLRYFSESAMPLYHYFEFCTPHYSIKATLNALLVTIGNIASHFY
jgi:hypothetical protein